MMGEPGSGMTSTSDHHVHPHLKCQLTAFMWCYRHACHMQIRLSPCMLAVAGTSIQASMSSDVASATEWCQKTFQLPECSRGCHIITKQVYQAVPEIAQYEVGLANLFSGCQALQ